MEKFIVVSDLHIGIHKDDEIWLRQTESLFDQIRDTAVKKNIDNIIIAGDFFHERKTVNVATMYRAYNILKSLSDFHIIILIGNHDTYYKNQIDPNSLYVFSDLSNVQIIDELTVIDDAAFLPWTTEKVNITEIRQKYLISHIEIDGFPATYKSNFFGGYDKNDFQHFEKVISGHFHIPSNRGNILYCGAPFHLTFSDKGSTSGYYIFDKGKIRFVENQDYAKYVRVTTEDAVDRKMIEGNMVSMNFVKDYGILGNNRKIEHMQSLNPLRLFPDFTNISVHTDISSTQEDLAPVKSVKEILHDYVSNIELPPHINGTTLLSIMEKMMESGA